MLVRKLSPLTVLALTALPLHAADLHVGPGAPFAEIQAAIDAAAPGDTIHVAPGEYDVFSLGKPLSILGAGSGSVVVRDPGNQLGCVVAGIPAGSQAVLSGFELGPPSAPLPMASHPDRLRVSNCAGRVTLHDLSSPAFTVSHGAPTTPWFSPRVVSITQCAQVIVSRSQLFGASVGKSGQVPVNAEHSNVWLVGSELRAGDNPFDSVDILFANATVGVPGLQLHQSTARVARSSISGGRGGLHFNPSFGTFDPESGGPAVLLSSSSCTVAGGAGNLLRGGNSTPASPNYQMITGGGSAFDLYFGTTSTLTAAADVVLEGGQNQVGATAPVSGSALVTLIEETSQRPTLQAAHVQPTAGASTALELSGPALSVQLPHAALTSIDALTLPFGDLLLPLSAMPLGAVALDAAGLANKLLAIPANPALAGTPVWLQSVSLAGGQLELSDPAFLVIGL